MDVLREMVIEQQTKRRRYEGEDAVLLKKVAIQDLTEATLMEKLSQHVEQVSS